MTRADFYTDEEWIQEIIATQRLEGIIVPPDEIEDLRKIASGKMTNEEYRNKIMRSIKYV